MSEIRKYVLVDEHDLEGDYEYESFEEAKRAAGSEYAITERIYEYADQELVSTPNGEDRWPPENA